MSVSVSQQSHRPKPFSSMARLAALARYVASSSKFSTKNSVPNNTRDFINNSKIEQVTIPSTNVDSTPIEALSDHPNKMMIEPIAVPMLRENSPPISAAQKTTLPTNSRQGAVLSARSGGFRFGNFAEVWFGNKLFLPRSLSCRGLCVLCLNYDVQTFHAWQFDFYPKHSAKKNNNNLIKLIQKLPAKVYFAMIVKDDVCRGFEDSTKQFLTYTVGCKHVFSLRFRDSWAAIVYKPTVSTFEVLGEDQKTLGIARVDVRIPISQDTQEKSNEILEEPSETMSIDGLPTEETTDVHPSEQIAPLVNLPRNTFTVPASIGVNRLTCTMPTVTKIAKKEISDIKKGEKELKHGLESVRKELAGHLFQLKDLKRESASLKTQIQDQIDAVRSIKELVVENESALKDLTQVLKKPASTDSPTNSPTDEKNE